MNNLVPVTDAVILARGLGTRMRAAGAELDTATATVAATGVKALIPIGTNRPFLDYVLHDCAEAGITTITLVIGPEHQELRKYYGSLATTRIRIGFAVQEKPLGTANAVHAAEQAVGDRRFIVINSDNTYPIAALRGLTRLPGCGLVGFTADGLVKGNIPRERVVKFAAIAVDATGHMERICEKPTAEQLAAMGGNPPLSMNCWCFDRRIFDACRVIKPSPRGELELPDAVATAMQAGMRLQVVPSDEPVIDLSSRDDIAAVRKLLGHRVVLL